MTYLTLRINGYDSNVSRLTTTKKIPSKIPTKTENRGQRIDTQKEFACPSSINFDTVWGAYSQKVSIRRVCNGMNGLFGVNFSAQGVLDHPESERQEYEGKNLTYPNEEPIPF